MKNAKTNMKIIVSAICLVLLFAAVASAERTAVKLTTADGDVLVEGDENFILKLLNALFGASSNKITGKVIEGFDCNPYTQVCTDECSELFTLEIPSSWSFTDMGGQFSDGMCMSSDGITGLYVASNEWCEFVFGLFGVEYGDTCAVGYGYVDNPMFGTLETQVVCPSGEYLGGTVVISDLCVCTNMIFQQASCGEIGFDVGEVFNLEHPYFGGGSAPAVCGNNLLEEGEECDGTRFCDPNTCKCMSGYIPDPTSPGFCKAAQVCGNGIVEGTEQCEFGQYCVNCMCQSPAVPDPQNPGYCYVPCTPTPNDCDGVDNDCDGAVDEADELVLTQPCGTGQCAGVQSRECTGAGQQGAFYTAWGPCPTNGNLCDDGTFCNGPDTCSEGACANTGPAVNCNDNVACTDDSCDENSDACVNAPNNAKCPADGLVEIGVPYWVDILPCDRELRQNREYRDYYCDTSLDCQYTATPATYRIVDYEDNDQDNDLVCDADDKCPDSEYGYATVKLNPNHYDSSNWDMASNYGCSCEQVLFCKPGANDGEYKFGCSAGTVNVWTTQTGWAPDCQINGVVAIPGEAKPLLENTDGSGLPDILSGDNDGDGIPDSEDPMDDDADETPTAPGSGKPDWWEKKNPGK
ncbi:hypothetical protein JW707_02290 [Candidatus Woesearchaeota archaeon]|nr:hypothetical protein [Candidatus Woesearchaeota archaeon]